MKASTVQAACPSWCTGPHGHFNRNDDAGWRLHERLVQEVEGSGGSPEQHHIWLTVQAEEQDGVVATAHLTVEVGTADLRSTARVAFLTSAEVDALALALVRGRTYMDAK